LRVALRAHHYSTRAEHAYLDWARRFIIVPRQAPSQGYGPSEVAAFLSYSAVDRSVSPSTQNQAKSAISFLYKRVLKIDLPWLNEVVQAQRKARAYDGLRLARQIFDL